MNHLFAGGLTAATIALSPVPVVAASKAFEVPPFTSLEISSGLNAVVSVGETQSVTAESPHQENLDRMRIEVHDGLLRAWTDWSVLDFLQFGSPQITITITVPELVRASANSGADVEVSDMSGEHLTLSSSSGADLYAIGAAGTAFELDASSGADLRVEGTCERAKASSSSGADLRADRLSCSEVSVNASSGASADVFASRSVQAEASSGASINVYGSPETVDQDVSSGADVDLRR